MPSATTATVIRTLVPEGSSRVYETRLKGPDGQPLTDIGSVTAITLLELRDVATNQIVNGRSNVNCLGNLGVDAWLRFTFTAADNAAIGTGQFQERRATWRVVYTDGVENHQLTYHVENLAGV